MASTVSVGGDHGVHEDSGSTNLIRVILADTQAIFRAGLRKIFALEDDIRVVGQAETLPQTQSAVTKFSADVLIFESALVPNPVEAVTELLRQLDDLGYEFPRYPVPDGETMDSFLRKRVAEGVMRRYGLKNDCALLERARRSNSRLKKR